MRWTLAFLALSAASAQQWPHWGGDAGGMKFSSLKQIDRTNVTKLREAWTYRTGDVSDGTQFPVRTAFEATPLVIDGVMYVVTPFARLIALDATTGKELWVFDPKIDKERSANLFIHRGPAYWSGGGMKRLFYGTLEGRLYAIDAATGKPSQGFGENGSIDFREGIGEKFPNLRVGMTSPPAIYKDLVICGSIVSDGEPRSPAGDVRAFSARTGKLVWRFHTVPRPGEFGNDTWEGDSWKDRGGTNAWSVLSVDEKRGLVFLPLTSPSTDLYGGDRKGQNLFGDSVVALNAATGKRVWHFQTIHHNIWDYDLPSQPALIEVKRGRSTVPAVAQATKMGFVFLFHRETGKPLFEIAERPVPASEIPGEQAWPTQPFPLKPPPVTRQSMTRDELSTVTPAAREFCAEITKDAIFGTLYTPIGLKPTVLFPGTNGGTNWGGSAFDPATQTLYINSMDVGMFTRMAKRPEGSEIPYRSQGFGTPNSRFWTKDMLPCQQPPWAHITAIDMNTGEFRWRSVLGVIDELVEKGIPPTGAPNLGGPMVTAGGLVFIGATNDSRFRAFDKDTGKELWVTRLPASAHANPITYLGKDGKQYVAIAAGGGNKYNSVYSDSLVVFSLP
ncbi:MAG: pyrroloquinoline quinone-dependent dehydrogenase [Bryobacterales bacterium]|nr:pyrroloquinoline quinone-dependent dehydrogenase [Bryobacterales bacterium]